MSPGYSVAEHPGEFFTRGWWDRGWKRERVFRSPVSFIAQMIPSLVLLGFSRVRDLVPRFNQNRNQSRFRS